MRKLCAAALPFCGVVWLAVTVLPSGWLIPLGIGCLALALLSGFLPEKLRLPLFLAAVGLAAGCLWTWCYQGLILTPARLLDGTEGSYTLLVTDWPRAGSYGYAIQVELEAGGRKLGGILYGEEESAALRPGDTVKGSFSLELADEVAGKKSNYSFSQGLMLKLSPKGEVSIDAADKIPLAQLPRWWARDVETAIQTQFPADLSPMLTALITGNRERLPDSVYSDFQRAGVAHVLVVSGLHVSFLAGLLSVLLRKRRWAAVVILPVLAVFAAVAGCTPSVLRAVFVQGFVLLAPLLNRDADRPTALTAVLAILLALNPYTVADVGLQLSFASVAGIYLCADPLTKRWTARLPRRPSGWRKMGANLVRFVAASVATTLGALLFTTPLTVYYFGMLSLAGPLTNLLILWAVSLLFQLCVAALAVGALIPPLGNAVAYLAAWLARYVLGVTEGISRFPWSAVEMTGFYLPLWLVTVYLLLALALVWKKGRKNTRPILPVCASVCTLCAALVCTAAETRLSDGVFAVLDVEQGQSVALCAGQRTVLVDCGSSSGISAGDVAANYFQSAGYQRLDVLILTHYHADHANGVARLLERMEVNTLIAPDVEPESALRREILAQAEEAGCQVVLLEENGSLQLDELSLTCYGPLGAGESNEEGLSVLCTLGSFQGLITGDMDENIEKRLVKYGDLPHLTVLVAGHHGSRTSTSRLLLEETAPRCAVISVGHNSYGQPADEVLTRLTDGGCTVYRTDQNGTVRYFITP